MTGEPSVSPYAMVISEQCISLTTRRIVSVGHGAPAMMPVRKDDRSYAPKEGWFNSAMNMVGTPYSAVHFSLATAANARSGSNCSSMTSVPPCVSTASTPSTQPKQWNSGTGTHTRSAGPSRCRSPM